VDDLAERLARRTLELVNIPSESRHEDEIRAHVLDLVPGAFGLESSSDEAFLFCGDRRAEAPLVVLAGHYDTVPAQENLPGQIADGAVHGLGASDMKGGLAVAIELVRDLAESGRGTMDVALLLFGREELPVEHDPLPALLEASGTLRDASLAILLEPTAGQVHAGCLGNLVAIVTFHGTSGHSARPWLSDNAITRAVDGLPALVSYPRRDVTISGLEFAETLSVTRLQAGIADNVIPDRASATISFRYAPDRTPEQAEQHLQSVVPDEATVEVVSNAAAGAVVTDAPLVTALVEAGAKGVAPKLAWTNVADFSAFGVDAVNFGPGDPAYAHRRDERVEIAALVHAYETLWRVLA
jgi:succinyl-diaminopimelate desuccinylase